MNLGFETVGNAILILHDGKPVLATDPWIVGPAYSGSWTRAHEIPPEQMASILQCEFIWLSHGHPDHLSMQSLMMLKNKKILLADHVGGRIARELIGRGFQVSILKDREWTNISPHINIVCHSDYNQDSLLLADVNGTLLTNLNDMTARGWGSFVQKTIRNYKNSVLLQGFGYGDADMINFVDEAGNNVNPPGATGEPIGKVISRVAQTYGVTHAVPFSSLHKYQRSDSVWARKYQTNLEDYAIGFDSDNCQLLPAYIQYNCENGEIDEIRPEPTPDTIFDPKEFNDDWSEPLESGEREELTRYFTRVSHLAQVMDFINFRVGGEDNVVELVDKGFKKGIVFEVPRHSLMRAIRYEIFDDLLIGNFMKTRFVGSWPKEKLYPDFTPYVSKYSDHGLARSPEELRAYFREYRRRAPIDYLRHRVQLWTAQGVKSRIDADSEAYRIAQKAWWFMRRHIGA